MIQRSSLFQFSSKGEPTQAQSGTDKPPQRLYGILRDGDAQRGVPIDGEPIRRRTPPRANPWRKNQRGLSSFTTTEGDHNAQQRQAGETKSFRFGNNAKLKIDVASIMIVTVACDATPLERRCCDDGRKCGA